MTTTIFVVLILAVFASEKKENAENGPKYGENSIVVKIEEDEYVKENKKSKYIGVSYNKSTSNWQVRRRSKIENKLICNGCYNDEETAAHASDTLTRKLMSNGEQNHKLNFPDDYTEVYPEEKRFTSKFIGVSFYEKDSKWCTRRWSKYENRHVSNGFYDDEETAAHASDTLARKLMKNAKQNHKLNFPDDYTEVYPEEKIFTSKYIGVSYYERDSKWVVRRWSKNENKMISKNTYDDEETAARASDTLARKLMENGEKNHKLNFPDGNTEEHLENQKRKRKRKKEKFENHKTTELVRF